MGRLASVDPATDSGPGADLLNGPLREMQINIFRGLATHPAMLEAFLGFSKAVKGAGSLTGKEHEVVALVTGQQNSCDYCLAAHTQIAMGEGLSEDDTLAVRRGEPADDRLRALATFVQRVLETEGFVDDADLEAFRAAGYDDAAVIEVLGAIAVNTFTNLFNHVHGTEIDFPPAPEA